jgi:two-component system LytT family sensor kinase
VEYDSSCMNKAPKSKSYNWLMIAALWAGLGLLDATQNVFAMRHAGMHHAWGRLFFVLTVAWLPWALATPLVVNLGRRFPIVRRSTSTWLLHVIAAVTIDLIASAWGTILELLLQPWVPDFVAQRFLITWPLKMFGGLLPAFILYAVILAATYLFDSRAKAARQETDAAKLNEQLSYAQLNALQRQIEPHFIFNALNSIAALVREKNNDAAVTMIATLSDFLRRVAASSSEPRVPLAEEVDHLRRYLQIQQARFAGRLHTELRIPTELLAARVPSLVLQPLVENAIKHGIAQRAQGGDVRVAASNSGGVLRLSVYNDGPLLDEARDAGREGIGLTNLRTRLKLLYGSECELRLQNHGTTGVSVSLALPYSES